MGADELVFIIYFNYELAHYFFTLVNVDMSNLRRLPYIALLPVVMRVWGRCCPHGLGSKTTSFCVLINSVDFPLHPAQVA